MSTGVLSSSRVGTLTPASTVTNGTNITRADYQRWAHEDRNHSTAETHRREREERKKFKLEEKMRWKSHGNALSKEYKEQMGETARQVQKAKEHAGAVGSSIRQHEEQLRKQRTELQNKWKDHGYELTQTYTIKAAQNNMRSLKAQNAGIVNGMHAKRQDHETIVEAQRQQAQDDRRARVEKIKAETTDNVTRAAKKAFVDERWDNADGQRELSEAWRKQRKEQELEYLESALAINAATSMDPAKAARKKAQEERAEAAAALKTKSKMLKEQSEKDAANSHTNKQVIHDSIHSLKFIPDEEAKKSTAAPERLKPFFSFRTPSRRTGPHEVTV